jgi:DNA adenine methylase
MSHAAAQLVFQSIDPSMLLPAQMQVFPGTRYMGSKHKLLPFIHGVVKELRFSTALDAFSGSGVVGYLLKAMGKEVVANDHLHFCYHNANSGIANSRWRLGPGHVEALLTHNRSARRFIQRTFRGLYFSDEDNRFLDNLIANLEALPNRYLRSVALAAASRACVKRRARGVFTYTGHRYDDGRRDLTLTLREHFVEGVAAWNAAVFDNGLRCQASCKDTFDLSGEFDLVYVDPPYFSLHSDNEYTRRYHFLEGFVRYWEGLSIQSNTETKKFKPPPTPFRYRADLYQAFELLFRKFADSIIVLSYSSNGLPTRNELRRMLKKVKRRVEVFSQAHGYSFGTHGHKVGNGNNRVEEYLFVGY